MLDGGSKEGLARTIQLALPSVDHRRGLVERTGQFDFEAPPDGYQPVLEIIMPRATDRWQKGADKEYFAKLQGNCYARFRFRLTTGGQHFFVIESYLNPAATNRNLEYDPEKQVGNN